jgi:hypothetical protein
VVGDPIVLLTDKVEEGPGLLLWKFGRYFGQESGGMKVLDSVHNWGKHHPCVQK